MRAMLLSALVVGAFAVAAGAQPPVPREPALQKTTVGSELYHFYCANCHGEDARGRPATPAMRTASTDLTRLAAKSGGTFPREAVRALLAKGPMKSAAHGTTDMPVWGAIFRAFDKNDTMADVRIDNLVSYIESIQTNAKQSGH